MEGRLSNSEPGSWFLSGQSREARAGNQGPSEGLDCEFAAGAEAQADQV